MYVCDYRPTTLSYVYGGSGLCPFFKDSTRHQWKPIPQHKIPPQKKILVKTEKLIVLISEHNVLEIQ